MRRIDGAIVEYQASTAEEFWEVISPQRHLFGSTSVPIFRGQANSKWKLEPSILRGNNHPALSFMFGRDMRDSGMVIFAEIHALKLFAECCDSAGLRIPADSAEFRKIYLNPMEAIKVFVMYPTKTWPSEEYQDLMALAQHHGLPTRLLDWTRRAHVAAYFAAAGALAAGFDRGTANDNRLAIWALNSQLLEYKLKDIQLIAVPGSNNSNIAAQQGLFTLLRQRYDGAGAFQGPHCLDDYMVQNCSPELLKVTLPTNEAPKVLDLCSRYGVTAATLHPNFYGAAQATLDYLACWARSEWTSGQDVLAETTAAFKVSE